MSVLSPLSLIHIKRLAFLPGFSLEYFLILYNGTHIIASSEEENNADNKSNQITINKGTIEK